MSDVTYTREQLAAAISAGIAQVDEITDTGPAETMLDQAAFPGAGPFTFEQVRHALDEAANDLDDAPDYENSTTIWEQDVRGLAVNAILHQLTHPGGSLRDAIVAAGFKAGEVDEVLGRVN